MHVQLRMHDAGWSADVERWESDSDSDDSESQDEDEGKELLKLMAWMGWLPVTLEGGVTDNVDLLSQCTIVALA